MNWPNLLSLLRILLIPLFVLVFYLPGAGMDVACAIIFGLAGVTDWLDGYLARKLNQTTPFGAFIDPVADKLMVVVADNSGPSGWGRTHVRGGQEHQKTIQFI